MVMDRLTGIEVFLRVAARGSFAGAAADLGLSRAMVSKHVQALEARLGSRLLNRTTRRLSLTEAGRSYYERAGALLEELRAADEAVGELQSGPHGLLRLNAPVSFGILHLGEAVQDFMASYPQLSVEVTLEDRQVDLVKEGYDLAVRIGRLTDSSLIARRLAPCRMLVCAAPAYLDRRGRPKALSELAEHDCLAYSYSAMGDEWRFQGPHGPASVRMGSRLRANNGDLLHAACLAGHGVTLSPTFICGPDVAAGRLERLLPDYEVPALGVHAIYPHARHLAAKVRAFVDFLVARYGPQPPWDAGLPPARETAA